MGTAADISQRRDDHECQSTAVEFLATLLGEAPDEVSWDSIHHLRGHAHCAGHELVVIAARDSSHHALVLTVDDWQAIRLASASERAAMVRAFAIESHARLMEALDLP